MRYSCHSDVFMIMSAKDLILILKKLKLKALHQTGNSQLLYIQRKRTSCTNNEIVLIGDTIGSTLNELCTETKWTNCHFKFVLRDENILYFCIMIYYTISSECSLIRENQKSKKCGA